MLHQWGGNQGRAIFVKKWVKLLLKLQILFITRCHAMAKMSARCALYISYFTIILFTLTATVFCADLILNEFKLRELCLFLQEWRFGHSRSSEVIDFGANQKRICDFLLVRNRNLGPILHHFGDLTAFMCSWSHLYSTIILWCCTRTPMLGSASA